MYITIKQDKVSFLSTDNLTNLLTLYSSSVISIHKIDKLCFA
jgi:hypothetical protein